MEIKVYQKIQLFKFKRYRWSIFWGIFIKRYELHLDGAANDYVGKGMNGGKIIVNPVHQGKNLQVLEILVYMVQQVENYMLEQLLVKDLGLETQEQLWLLKELEIIHVNI